MMEFRLLTALRVAIALLITIFAATSSSSQTSSELRAKYGEPRLVWLIDGRPELERYLVRPNIVLTIRYTNKGQPCELAISPEKPSNSDTSVIEYVPNGDLMPTETVISLINELAPIERRGEKLWDANLNGGDDKMTLHHPGCTGIYSAMYKHVTIECVSWCAGGVFSVTIHWGEVKCVSQHLTIKKNGSTGEDTITAPGRSLTVKKKN